MTVSVESTWCGVNLSLAMIIYLLVQQRNCLLATVLIQGNRRGEYLGENRGKGNGKSLQTCVSYIKMLNAVVLTDSADIVGHLVPLRMGPLI